MTGRKLPAEQVRLVLDQLAAGLNPMQAGNYRPGRWVGAGR